MPRRAIMEAVWGHDVDTASNVLEAVVKALRKKMGDGAEMIETIRGVGYRFRRPSDHSRPAAARKPMKRPTQAHLAFRKEALSAP